MSIFKNIEKSLIEKNCFVCYRKPNSNVISSFFQNNAELHLSKDLNSTGFVFAPFDDQRDTIIIPKDNSTYKEEFFSYHPFKFSKKNNLKDTTAKKLHLNLVEKGISAINDNQLKKVVLSRKETINLKNKINIVKLFKSLLNSYFNAFVYVWFHPKIGLWLGATPETLVRINGRHFETMALAGTLPFSENSLPNWTTKEIEEQKFVTDYILKNLNPLCKKLSHDKVKTIKAGTLVHLHTKIEGELLTSNSELIKALHPTPAVCGVPMEESKQFILENERYDRAFYTGFLGELNFNNRTELFVNLRCMEIKNSQALIYVGGGITKDSISIKEWEETSKKSMTMRNIIKKIT